MQLEPEGESGKTGVGAVGDVLMGEEGGRGDGHRGRMWRRVRRQGDGDSVDGGTGKFSWDSGGSQLNLLAYLASLMDERSLFREVTV